MPTATPPQNLPQPTAAVLAGRTFRMMRKAHGLNLSQMAELVGVTPSHLSRVESGERPASERLQGRIVDVLDTLPAKAAS